MLLEGRNAVIYGGGGAIGGAVARAFAREGATVHLSGRTQETLDAVAEDIRSRGGVAETAVLDALDEEAVDAHADAMPGSRHLVQRHHARRRTGHAAGRDVAGRLRAPGRHRGPDDVHHHARGRAAHDAAALRRDPRVRRLRRPAARLQPRRSPGRVRRAGVPAPQPRRRARALRHPRADDPDRRRPGLDPRRASPARTRSPARSRRRRCSAARRRSRTSATWPPSPPPTGRAR